MSRLIFAAGELNEAGGNRMTRSLLRECVFALIMITTAGLVGCGDDDDDDDDRDSGMLDGGGMDSAVDDAGVEDGGAIDSGGADAALADAAPDAATAATFTTIYTGVMSSRCAIPGCHVPPAPTGALDLSTQAIAYASLVGVDAMGPACGATDFVRVVPGDAAMSLLYLKASETTPPCGARMPLTGEPLSAEEQALVASWINAGAQDN